MDDSPIFCQKRSGAFFTSREIAHALVSWALRASSDRLLDPSCGDGQFISLHRNSVGIEQNPISARNAIDVAPWALVHEGDFFAWAAETPERFECAAGNPPFIRYQSFSGAVRKKALDLCANHGAHFSGLTSSWAPFLVATASLLKPGGRMAFVVPAEIGHAPYAAPLLDYLVENFSTIQILAVREKLFPSLSEDCWLLYAEGFGGSTTTIEFTSVDAFNPSKKKPKATVLIDVSEWRNVWSRRLRPFILPKEIRKAYANALNSSDYYRFGDFARIGIGYVSGDNDFFHLRPSEAKSLKISPEFLHPSLRNGRAMPAQKITKDTVDEWIKNDEKIFLLKLSKNSELSLSVKKYLDSFLGSQARQSYKCRNRTPWYAVPDVQIPDFIMSYMSGRSVNLVSNLANVTCTNSVHSVRVFDKALADKLLTSWNSPFVRLSCEIEGHALGGGMLKLEPREATRIMFPSQKKQIDAHDKNLTEAINIMQRWRHYVD